MLDRLYVCPISLKCYTIDSLKNGNLSLEHIPPQSLGGKGILLTSKKENNQDGYTSDKELLSFFKSENFKNNGGEINVSINSEHFNLKGITAKLTIEGRETKPIVKLTSSTQNIKALDFKGLFQEWDGSSFSLNWKQHLNINKRALLKCAYLTAFSKIGYGVEK